MNVERVIGPLNQLLSKLSRSQILIIALAGIVIVGIPDYLFGFDISLAIFYLWPVGLATWYAGRNSGGLVAVISAFAGAAADVSGGNFGFHPAIITWNGLLHLAFMLVVVYLLDKLHSHIEIEQQLARVDPVTGIFNRRAFHEQLQHHLDLAGREKSSIVVAYIDLDDFKLVNDQNGHAEGDRVLRLVARTLTESIRRTDVVARLGGDEFALLIIDADRTHAERVITKLRLSLAQVFKHEQNKISCSIGCAIFQAPLPNARSALETADSLMYKVKSQGKNAVAFEVFGNSIRNSVQLGTVENSP